MNRRQFLTQSAVIGAGLCLPLSNPPNVILIMADDLGFRDLGCYGNPAIKTPNLDALARVGTRYTQAYSPGPVCSPTRFCMMTGQNVGHSRILSNASILYADDNTVAKRFRAAGYRTGIIGSWSINNINIAPHVYPLDAGFDYHFGYRDWSMPKTYYQTELWENDTIVQVSGWTPDVWQARALDWIAGAEPFFLYYALELPHVVQTKCKLGTGYNEIPDDSPYTDEDWPQLEKNFAAMVTRMDALIGELVSAAPANTIVVFTSDNGPEGECGRSLDFHHPFGLRGQKRSLYEGGIRAPLIMAGPGVSVGVDTTPICTWGLPGVNAGMTGDSTLYWAYVRAGVLSEAVRLGNWKGIRHNLGAIELYHLPTDPGETVNRAGEKAGIVDAMGRVMAGYCVLPKRCYWGPVVGVE